MIQDIIDGITNAISEVKEIEIHLEEVKQGFDKPCFFILPITEKESNLIGDRAKRTLTFDVHYFTNEKDEPKADLLEVASFLYPSLRRITLPNGDLLNGFNLHYEIVDGVLHFFVTYKPIVIYPNHNVEEDMRKLEALINAKE